MKLETYKDAIKVLGKLSPSYQYLLLARCGALGRVPSLADISGNFGVTRQAIHKQEKFALRIVKKLIKSKLSEKKIKQKLIDIFNEEE